MNSQFVTLMQEAESSNSDIRIADLVAYWDSRADSYLYGVAGELSDDRGVAWRRVVVNAAQSVFASPGSVDESLHILDLGCGPGFFEVLFANLSCRIDAVDASPQMIARARQNLSEHSGQSKQCQVTFHTSDVSSLPFADNTFDLAIARNVTWLLLDPKAAYAEWLRVLRPGGMLLVFDGNWYRYLFHPDIDAQRRADQAANSLEGWDESAQADAAEELEFEKTAKKLPMSPVMRPDWDKEILGQLGATSVEADEGIWRELWTESEQAYYRSSPMFLVKATK
jgi:SAM-dependent methyltransferase